MKIKNVSTEWRIYTKLYPVFKFPYAIHKEIKMLESMFVCVVATFLIMLFDDGLLELQIQALV